MGFKPYRRGYDELVSEEIKRAVRDFRGEFPANKAVFIIMPANSGFSGVLFFFILYPFTEPFLTSVIKVYINR